MKFEKKKLKKYFLQLNYCNMTDEWEILAQQEAEQQAEQDWANAQAEYDAQCRDQAEYECQQARDEEYYHNSCQCPY